MPCSAKGKFVVLTCLVAFNSVQAIGGSYTWNYTDQEFWTTVAEWDCGGMRQSPIDIVTNNLVMSGDLIDLVLTNFDQSYSGNFTNTGHSVQFTPEGGSTTARFQNHQGTYELQQFHFHWGADDTVGSEHTINGSPYSGELHFVTKRTEGSDNANNAYAVLGVLLSSDTSDPDYSPSLDQLDNIPMQAGATNVVSGVTPMAFLPSNLSYYYYEGSLTTPPCSQVVQWFLLRNPVSLPSDFLADLRNEVKGEDDERLITNFRTIQNMNGRMVMIQAESSGGNGGGGGGDDDSAACKVTGKGLMIFVAVIVHLFYY